MTSPVLAAAGVSMQFGGLRALNDVSFALTEGEIIGLIGPNGAGKTTLFNCLTGQYTPTSGTISRSGKPLPEDPARVTEEGVARTFQNIRLFPSMTASENVMVGRHVRMKQSPLSSLLHGPGYRKSEAEAAARTEELLEEAVEEHLSIKRLIADLLEMDPAEAQFDAKIAVLKEQVEHHVEEEEGDLFPKVRKLLSADELEDLGVVMEDLAEELKEGGAPRAAVPAETGEAASLE